MNRLGPNAIAAALVLAAPAASLAQQTPPAPQPYTVGNPIGLPVTTPAGGTFEPVSSNVKVFGAIYSAESCSYDPKRGVIVVPNRGVPQNVQTNDAFVSFINHDGSVHTARWIGVQNPADRDGGTTATEPSVAVIRKFSMITGAPAGEIRVERSTWLNDIEVAEDGTIYGTQTGDRGDNADPNSWQVLKITPDGKVSVFVQGAPLKQPNGIAFDPQGNIVVVNIGTDDVITFDASGKVVRTEKAAQAGNDGLVIMPDGTKYVSSVLNGGVSRIRPGKPAELIARNIPSAASMCYDAGARQLVIPMNPNNGLAFLKIE